MKIKIFIGLILIPILVNSSEYVGSYDEYMTQLRTDKRAGNLKWEYGCNTDEFTDFKGCRMVRFFSRNRSIRIENIFGVGVLVSFGLNNDPTIPGKVRIDSNQVEIYHDSMLSKNQSLRIIKQMRKGKKGISQTQIWPNENDQFKFDLKGFDKAYTYFLIVNKLYKIN